MATLVEVVQPRARLWTAVKARYRVLGKRAAALFNELALLCSQVVMVGHLMMNAELEELFRGPPVRAYRLRRSERAQAVWNARAR